MKHCQPTSLAERPKCRSDSFFLIHQFRNKDHLKQHFVEFILISEITILEIRITSTLRRYFCQTVSLPGFHFEKPPINYTAHLTSEALSFHTQFLPTFDALLTSVFSYKTSQICEKFTSVFFCKKLLKTSGNS